MYRLKNIISIIVIIVLAFFVSCQDLDELNINPNGVDPANADLNLLMPTFLIGTGQQVVSLGVGDIAGVMQHTQKDGWSGGHNDYDWSSQSWSAYYGNLRNIYEFHKKAVEGEYQFHEGIALVMKAYNFGMITDLWGDAPFSEALKAEDGSEFFKPKFDPQKEIYLGILADLESANTLLSQSSSNNSNINSTQDLLYKGDAAKWRKLANSLALRYYMRLSAKESGIAQEGISKIASDPGTYPVITNASEDATLGYIGSSPSDSWPTNTVYDTDPRGSYFRVKMCATLVDAMQELNDPRLGVYANKIEIPLQKVEGENIDRIVNGIRQVSQDIIDDYMEAWGVGVDFDPEYVGTPPSVYAAPQYNLNPNLDQAVYNPHCSQLNDIYKQTDGDLLLMRLMSAAEVHFILAEAAMYGWAPGSPEEHYAAGIQQSFNAWGIGGAFAGYIDGAPYTGLESIIEQKWIASWTAAAEAWFDWRRTGLPELHAGESARRKALPLRFYYHLSEEISKNQLNADEAIN
ncbi:MAG: SusD/RagB family nutrient-binding outer membrane lipoprotein, partial [Prolixibacteraceae bacterium]|nr:SusD/RagB family nutrient-binding outer membrane lipoprotein [Prolixibacteraceae bacterium]